jgi:flagellin
MSITQADLGAVAYYVGTASGAALAGTAINTVFGSASGAAAAVTTITAAIQNLATLRASNGSEQVRLTFAADMLAVNKTNLEAANSRITDVDVAEESSNLARFNILQQAGTAMLAQANQSTQQLLKLIG